MVNRSNFVGFLTLFRCLWKEAEKEEEKEKKKEKLFFTRIEMFVTLLFHPKHLLHVKAKRFAYISSPRILQFWV